MTEPKMRIKSICVYPIKSLRGCTVPSLSATPTGFEYDRRFMLQRISDEKHISVGKSFEICLFSTELSPAENPTKILVRYSLDHTFNKPDSKLEPSTLEVPLTPQWKADNLKEREVNMHSSPTRSYEMGDKYNDWFTARFGYPVRLLYIGENRRQVLGSVTPNAKSLSTNSNTSNQSWFSSVGNLINNVTGYPPEPTTKGIDTGIGFADVAPFLIVSSKSYDNAAARMSKDTGEELDIYKFRPNLIIEGAAAEYEEDFWAELSIGANTRIVLTSNCARCASINVDYDTGKAHEGEQGKILKLLQKDRRVDPGMKYSPIFGRYGFLARRGEVEEQGEVQIRVGDEVAVVRRNGERDRFQWPGISTDK